MDCSVAILNECNFIRVRIPAHTNLYSSIRSLKRIEDVVDPILAMILMTLTVKCLDLDSQGFNWCLFSVPRILIYFNIVHFTGGFTPMINV